KPRERFGLVHLAVAHEAPHLAPGGFGEAAMLEIAHEARLVDREERPDAHRARRELPELRHEPRMRIGAQAVPRGLAPVVVELLAGEPPLEVRARINAGRGMRLEIHEIALLARAEEVVEADLEEIRRGGIARDVPAQLRRFTIRTHDHRE